MSTPPDVMLSNLPAAPTLTGAEGVPIQTGSGGAYQGTYLTPVGAISGGLETTAETFASITPTITLAPEGYLTRYGGPSNTAAGSNALLVSAVGGSAAYVTPTSFPYTVTLQTGQTISATLYTGSSMNGAGRSSILKPNGCDGLTFNAGGDGNYAGSRELANFQIQQQSGTFSNNGVLLATPYVGGGTPKTTGVKINNLTINGCATAFNGQGFWNLTIEDPFFFGNYNGVNLQGLNVGINIVRGLIQQGSATAAGSPTNYGIQGIIGSGSQQPQSITIDGVGISQFAVSCFFSNGINVNIINGNYSFSTQYSVQIGAMLGCTNVVNNWCNPNAGSGEAIAIYFEDLASATWDKARIVGNSIALNSGSTSSIGIYVGANQMGRSVKDNAVGCDGQPVPIGISIAGASATVKDNTVNATITAILLNTLTAVDCNMGPNTIVPGALQAATMSNGSTTIGVPNIAAFSVGAYCQFDTTANGLYTRVDYYVLSATPTSGGAGNITVGPLGGTAVISTGSIALNVFPVFPPVQFTSTTPAGFRLNGRGAFWAQASGFSGTTPAGVVNWVAAHGQVTLFFPTAFSGTSDAPTMTLLGLPRYLWPYASGADDIAWIIDNGVAGFGICGVGSAGVVSFAKDAANDSFTASGTKAIQPGKVTYAYN